MSKILLLDRDGVINHKAKHTRYVHSWADFSWIDDNVAAATAAFTVWVQLHCDH